MISGFTSRTTHSCSDKKASVRRVSATDSQSTSSVGILSDNIPRSVRTRLSSPHGPSTISLNHESCASHCANSATSQVLLNCSWRSIGRLKCGINNLKRTRVERLNPPRLSTNGHVANHAHLLIREGPRLHFRLDDPQEIQAQPCMLRSAF